MKLFRIIVVSRRLHKERQENYFDPQLSSTILQRMGDGEGSSLQDREQGEVGREHYNSAVHHNAHYGQRPVEIFAAAIARRYRPAVSSFLIASEQRRANPATCKNEQ